MATMTKADALAAVAVIADEIRSLVGPLSSWAYSPDALDRLAAAGLRDRVHNLAIGLIGLPAEDVETVAVALDAVCAHDEYARDELAGRLRSAVRRLELVERMRRHPRADRFYTLVQAVSRGKATGKQMDLARKLAGEVSA